MTRTAVVSSWRNFWAQKVARASTRGQRASRGARRVDDRLKQMREDTRFFGGPWTAESVLAAAFFMLFLLIQTAVPLVQLWAPRPARFGWQMFSARQQSARFSLVLRDGTAQPAKLDLYVAQSRGEVDLGKALPRHLCRVVPDLAAVQITAPDSKQPRVYKCP